MLDSEVQRWSAMSCDQLVFGSRNSQAYKVELDAKESQVEVRAGEVTGYEKQV